MTKKEHIVRHKKLHAALDELLADFVAIECRGISNVPLTEFLEWSQAQTKNPRTESRLRQIS